MEIEDAVNLLGKCIKPISQSEEIFLHDSYSRILAENVFAPIAVPSFPKSAMDGYAVYSGDTVNASPQNPVQLEVAGNLFAGDFTEKTAEHGTAWRVMTGSFVPKDFDAVVMQEDTDFGEKTVRIYKPVAPFQNYCKVGEDIKKGEKVLEKGMRIARTEIALLSSLGVSKVKVQRKPVVSFLCTGSELCNAGQPLEAGKIYSSLLPSLCLSSKNDGFSVPIAENIPDDEVLISDRLLEAAKTSDIIVTTGGISVGKKDLLPKIMQNLGAKKIFSHVNIQPGTPTAFYMLDDKPVLCLSGNPYAAFANFDIYFYNASYFLTGCASFIPKEENAVLATPYKKTNRLRRQIRAFFDGGRVYIPSEKHESSVIKNLLECNCYIDLKAGEKIEVGEKVKVRFMRGRL